MPIAIGFHFSVPPVLPLYVHLAFLRLRTNLVPIRSIFPKYYLCYYSFNVYTILDIHIKKVALLDYHLQKGGDTLWYYLSPLVAEIRFELMNSWLWAKRDNLFSILQYIATPSNLEYSHKSGYERVESKYYYSLTYSIPFLLYRVW